MLSAIACLQPGIQYAYSTNLYKKLETSVGINCLCDTYNGFRATNMQGITFLYNYRTGNTAMSGEQLNNLDRLYDIMHLKEDWNGYGAQKISLQAIKMAEEIIKNVCIQPTIFPTGRNSIQMQYELEDRSYLEFEVFESKILCMEVPKRIYEKAIFKEFIHLDTVKINQIVKEFYGKQNTRK